MRDRLEITKDTKEVLENIAKHYGKTSAIEGLHISIAITTQILEQERPFSTRKEAVKSSNVVHFMQWQRDSYCDSCGEVTDSSETTRKGHRLCYPCIKEIEEYKG